MYNVLIFIMLMSAVSCQAQAIVVGFLASMAAMILGWIPQGKFNIYHGLLLCSSSVLTAAVASFILGESVQQSLTIISTDGRRG